MKTSWVPAISMALALTGLTAACDAVGDKVTLPQSTYLGRTDPAAWDCIAEPGATLTVRRVRKFETRVDQMLGPVVLTWITNTTVYLVEYAGGQRQDPTFCRNGETYAVDQARFDLLTQFHYCGWR